MWCVFLLGGLRYGSNASSSLAASLPEPFVTTRSCHWIFSSYGSPTSSILPYMLTTPRASTLSWPCWVDSLLSALCVHHRVLGIPAEKSHCPHFSGSADRLHDTHVCAHPSADGILGKTRRLCPASCSPSHWRAGMNSQSSAHAAGACLCSSRVRLMLAVTHPSLVLLNPPPPSHHDIQCQAKMLYLCHCEQLSLHPYSRLMLALATQYGVQCAH